MVIKSYPTDILAYFYWNCRFLSCRSLLSYNLYDIGDDILRKPISEARHLKSVEALLDDEDINKTKEISKDAARTE